MTHCLRNNFLRRLSAFLLLIPILCSWPPTESIANDHWRLYASVNEFTGAQFAPVYLAEVFTDTQTATKFFDVPLPGTNNLQNDDWARDLLVDQFGDVRLYNGTFDPYLLSLDISSGSYTQETFDGWSSVNDSTYGGIARLTDSIYLTDMETTGGPPQGILEYNINSQSFVRFATEIEPEDLNIGLDGLLYAIDGFSDPTDEVFIYDPVTHQQIDIVDVERTDHRSVAAIEDGTFFTATWDGRILHYDRDGNLLNSLAVPTAQFADMDINADGQIALGTRLSGEVVLTTTALDSFERFRITESTIGGDIFVTWGAAVPEPSSIPVLVLLGLVTIKRRRK
jgi:hypothetical protein